VNGVSKGIEAGGNVKRNALGKAHHVYRRNDKVLGETAVAVHAHANSVYAKMPAPCHAVSADATDYVPLAGNDLAGLKAANPRAYLIDGAHVFMPDDKRRAKRPLAPGIPIVDVKVGAADRRFQHAYPYLARPGGRNRLFP